ncbi:monocarboxylate transporter 12-like [Lytechinus variegatus]|uniref:monocarboxylate transporter 12-like n=1 Tax=Lytechinus variegatus TaxID=7654 RepID=UPI001BB0F509|nr:monocarboxylate transporter 12-like [Lytechinus variegatus]
MMGMTDRRLALPRSFPVVLLMFLMACSQVGTIKSIGIYLEDISWSLGTTSTDIGVALGLFNAFGYFPAPLIVALYRLRSIRRGILILGSCFISLGVILTAMATNNILIAVYLSISGIGHCIIAISTTVALDQLASKKNFNVLFGLGMSGFGLGMVLLPFLADVIGQVYGWRGGLLILGGLMANLIPCAMAIQAEPSIRNEQTSDAIDNLNQCEFEGIGDSLTDDEATPLCPESTAGTNSDRNKQRVDDHRLAKSTAVEKNREEPLEQNRSSRPFLHKLSESVRRSDFYRDPVINLMCFESMMFGVMYCGWHGFLVPHAIQRGYSINATILMTFFASTGNFLGRLLAGALSDRLSKPVILYLVVTLLNSVSILCDAILHNFYVMFVTACLSAISIASMSVLGPLALRNRASPETFDIVYAINEQIFGFGTFIGGYLSGLVGGLYSSYDATFKLLGCVNTLIFLFLFPVILIKKPE